MRKITRTLMIGAVVAAVGSIGVGAIAQPSGPGYGPSCVDGHRGYGMMGRGAGGFHSPATHLTALKTDLGIKPEQAAAWNTYAKVVRDTAAQMAANRATLDMGAIHAMPNKERAAFLSDQMDLHDQAQAKIKAAAEALLPLLDDAQKAKAQKELPGLATRGPGGMRHAEIDVGGMTDQPTGGASR
jgi:LTXXQ motif family protein